MSFFALWKGSTINDWICAHMCERSYLHKLWSTSVTKTFKVASFALLATAWNYISIQLLSWHFMGKTALAVLKMFWAASKLADHFQITKMATRLSQNTWVETWGNEETDHLNTVGFFSIYFKDKCQKHRTCDTTTKWNRSVSL